MRTLVLDVGYQPINAVPFAKAITYILKGKVDVLESYERLVHSNWHAPAVVRLTYWIRPHTHQVRFSRQNVLARDRWRCQFCGARKRASELTFDHVIPRSRGGRTSWDNIVMACVPCNAQKANRTPEEAGMRLRSRPVRPSWLPAFNMTLQQIQHIPTEWQEYWTVELVG